MHCIVSSVLTIRAIEAMSLTCPPKLGALAVAGCAGQR
jgi:hypothetical protein